MPDSIFTLPALVAWLEKQPADGKYDAGCPNTCLFAQYALDTRSRFWAFLGRRPGNPFAVAADGFEANGLSRRLRVHITMAAPHTFGAALTRARALLAKQRSTDVAVERIKADALAEREGV